MPKKIYNHEQLSQATINKHNSIKKSILEICNKDNIQDIIEKPDIYAPIILNTCKKQSTCKTYLSTILAIMRLYHRQPKEIHTKWTELFYKVHEDLQKNLDNNTEKDNTLSWEEIIIKMKELETNNYASIEHLTLALYALTPPGRQKEFSKMYVTTNENEEIPKDVTSILHTDGTFQVIQGKTITVKKLPPKLIKIIQDYMNKRSKRNETNNYLFTQIENKNKLYATPASFTSANNRRIKNMFNNQKVTVNSFRHAAATLTHQDKSLTMAQRKQIANMMGHSFQTHLTYVQVKKDEDINEEDIWEDILKKSGFK